jgi:hypothetical protein
MLIINPRGCCQDAAGEATRPGADRSTKALPYLRQKVVARRGSLHTQVRRETAHSSEASPAASNKRRSGIATGPTTRPWSRSCSTSIGPITTGSRWVKMAKHGPSAGLSECRARDLLIEQPRTFAHRSALSTRSSLTSRIRRSSSPNSRVRLMRITRTSSAWEDGESSTEKPSFRITK